VFNPKISGIIAGIAFVLSILIGLFTGSQFFPVFLRALIIAPIVFVLSSLLYWLISQFLPELLASPSNVSDDLDVPGSKVDISIDESELAVSSADDIDSITVRNPASEPTELVQENNGDIDEQSSIQGLDQKPQDDYNKAEEGSVPQSLIVNEKAAVPEKDASGSGDYSKSLDVLPDLESMSGSFAPAEEEEEAEVEEMEDDFSSAPSSSEPKRSSKKHSDPGDFNVQELASAIQTVLRREEKG
jgi:hypothetical protein